MGRRKNNSNEALPVMTEDQEAIMKELVRISEFMDTSWITICGIGLGADGLLGLVFPELGDIGTSFVSLWIMMRILFVFPQVFRRKWCTMLFNVGIDLLFGLVPLLGDAFDMYWHANVKNVNIVRKHYGLELLSEAAPKKDEEQKNSANRELELTEEGQGTAGSTKAETK